MAFRWSLFNWIADVGVPAVRLLRRRGAVRRWSGVTVAYAAARAVGSIPLMPGGLLVVEAVLVPGLVSSGMTLASAISAMLIYRLISWIFIAAIGWVVFFFMFRTEKDIDPDAVRRTRTSESGPPQFSPDPEAPARTRAIGAARMRTGIRTVIGGSRRRRAASSSLRTPRTEHVASTTATLGHRRTVVTPVVASPWSRAPIPVPATDGKVHLAYELQLTNVLTQDVTLTSLAVVAGDQTLLTPVRRPARRTGRVSSETPRPQRNSGPAQTALVWLDVALDQARHRSRAELTHAVGVSPCAKPQPPLFPATMTETVAPVTVQTRKPAVIAPPLVGPNWLDGNSCCDMTRAPDGD